MPHYRKSYLNNFIDTVKYLKNIKYTVNLFDVSLRDGLQSKKEIYSLNSKKTILHDIINKENPKSIEVGSLVSNKVLPQMSNSLELYHYAKSLEIDTNFYLLIPNLNYTKKAIKYNVENMSFITSVSNDFQMKNIKKSLNETKNEIKFISELIMNEKIENKKLYISCINQCPISGIIDNNFIVNEILYYDRLNSFDELCLSDTCGKLDFNNFKIIIDALLKNMQSNKLSLHLHMSDDFKNLNNIINYSLENNINNFDISILNSGGCSVTMEKDKLNNNLTYEALYKIINND